MERIKITMPDAFLFSTIISIRITDLNYGGHVGNDSFLSLVHEAREQFLRHLGYTELNVEGAGLIMADSAIEYKTELSYGDTIKISVAASGFDRLGFDLHYLLEVKSEDGWLIAGKVKTGMLCFDYAQKKKVSVPAKAIEKLMGK
jgi:YbgC/YbaW family acyl-CoA thioester hydrolase